MCLHLPTKYFSCAVIGAVQFDIQTAITISGGEVFFTLLNLQHCLAAMLFVGAVHLQLLSLPVRML